jgi:hypothetical protein
MPDSRSWSLGGTKNVPPPPPKEVGTWNQIICCCVHCCPPMTCNEVTFISLLLKYYKTYCVVVTLYDSWRGLSIMVQWTFHGCNKKKTLCKLWHILELQNLIIKTFIAYKINSAMKIFCAIHRFSGWVEDKCWTDSLSCYETWNS